MDRGGTRKGPYVGLAVAALLALGGTVWLWTAGRVDPELVPDETLQAELGLGARDRVYTVVLTGGESELSEPAVLEVVEEGYVEFVTSDWLVHEVIFEVDSLSVEARAFLEHTDQVDSPPLLRQGSRFLMDFEGAPMGRYPYLLEGNGRPGRGVVVVVAKP